MPDVASYAASISFTQIYSINEFVAIVRIINIFGQFE